MSVIETVLVNYIARHNKSTTGERKSEMKKDQDENLTEENRQNITDPTSGQSSLSLVCILRGIL